MRQTTSHSLSHVVIAGGGVAALEALLGLKALAGRRVKLTVVSPERDFLYRPVTVAEAFDRGEAVRYSLREIVASSGGELICDSIQSVDHRDGAVVLGSGARIDYDHLIVAVGAIARAPLPGALTFGGRNDVRALRGVLDELASGSARSVAFTLPAERMWTLPIYELALMTAAHLRDREVAAEVWLVTPEDEPLELFGPAATAAIRSLLDARRVRVRTSALARAVRGRTISLAGAGQVFADRVITLPRLEGPRLSGLPQDRNGFIPVDCHGRVPTAPGVYAAGDVCAFPLKQGGLASQQADAVAEAISAELGAPITPRPFTPVLRGLLLTAGAPLYVRSEPQRLARSATVAIEATARPRSSGHTSLAADHALWWPPAKIAGRYLAPYLAAARPRALTSELLRDRVPVPGPPVSGPEFDDALELALLLADSDARWGDYPAALAALAAAEALRGVLPPDYEVKRQQWRAAARAA